jgi:hypothetical protein
LVISFLLFLSGRQEFEIRLGKHYRRVTLAAMMIASFNVIILTRNTAVNLYYPEFTKDRYLIQGSQFQNVPLWPISALGSNFNPQNTQCILPVEIFARLDLDQTETF